MATRGMKILYYNPFLLSNDGSGIHSREFVRFAQKTGVNLITYPIPKLIIESGSKQSLFGIQRKYIPEVFAIGALVKSFVNSLCQYLALRLLVEQQKPDIILQRLHALDWAGYWLHLTTGLPLVVELNSPISIEVGSIWGKRGIRPYSFHEQKCLKDADAITVVSEELANLMADLKTPTKRVVVNPNGVDIEKFKLTQEMGSQIRTKLGIPSDASVIGFTGSMKPWHGIHNLLQAFDLMTKKQSNLYLLIIGPSEKNMNARVIKREGVFYVGQVMHDEIPFYLSACNVCVAPYPKINPFYFSPIKVIEYMAMGLPVIASDQGQNHELLASGRGVLIEPDDNEELANSLIWSVTNKSSSSRMGKIAQDYVRNNLTWEHNVQRALKVCKAVVD